MAFDAALKGLMSSTFQLQTLASFSTDGYLTATYSTAATSWKCRLTRKPTMIRDQDGIEQMAAAVAWIASSATFSAFDKFTVDGSTIGRVLRIDHLRDEDGHHHSKVWWG